MRFEVLGPVRASAGGREVALGSHEQQRLLALLLAAPAGLTADRLVDELWGEAPPASARHLVQVYVSRLRAALGPAGGQPCIRHDDGRYSLLVAPEDVDARDVADRARDARARMASDPTAARGALVALERRWRGTRLRGVGRGIAPARGRGRAPGGAATRDRRRPGRRRPAARPSCRGGRRAGAADVRAPLRRGPLAPPHAGAVPQRPSGRGPAGQPRPARPPRPRSSASSRAPRCASSSAASWPRTPNSCGSRRHPARTCPTPLTSFVGRAREIATVSELVGERAGRHAHRSGRDRQDPARHRGRRARPGLLPGRDRVDRPQPGRRPRHGACRRWPAPSA